MLRQLILNSKSVSSLLQPNGWPKQHLSFLTRTTSRRWKSDQTRAYKAAVLEEFNEKLSVESITNRTKLGDGMVKLIYSLNSMHFNKHREFHCLFERP